MKKINIFLLIATLFFAGCNDDDGFDSDIKSGGVWMKMGDGMIVGTSDIDFYIASTNTFFLKHDLPYLKKIDYGGSFSVFVDKTEIYNCAIYQIYSSSFPEGAYLANMPFYQAYIMPIGFSSIVSDKKNVIPDLRNDPRIINALKKYGQFREGLKFEMQSIKKSNGNVILTGELYNPDTSDYYYFDPDKMGMGLFHYFTNGLLLYDMNFTSYTNQETVIEPVPWDSWDKNWMSLIKRGERKKISLSYNNFEEVPPGNYHANFSFPGLSYTTEKKEIQQAGGRIWLGNIYVTKDVVIE